MHIRDIRAKAIAGAHGFPTGRNWYEWCQAGVGWLSTISNGGTEPHWYLSARAAWNASPHAVSKDPYAAPPGALHWFTANHPDYDVKVSLGRGRIVHAYKDQADMWSPLINFGEDEWADAARKAPWMNTTYLGWTYGFGPGGRYKIDVQVEDPAPAGTVRFWNAQGEGVARARVAPTTNSARDDSRDIADGDYGDMDARIKGEKVDGIDDWVRGFRRPERFWWAGSFKNRADVAKLPLIKTETPAPPTPPTPPYKPADLSWATDLTPADFAVAQAWISYDEQIDPDSQGDPFAKNEADWRYYFDKYGIDRPYEPKESHVHWWNDPGEGDTHDGIVKYLAGKTDLSATFVTSPGRVTRMGSLLTASYTSGAQGMQAWTSENDPIMTTSDAKAELGYRTLAFVHYLMESKNPRLRGESILLHREIIDPATGKPTATRCSQIDTARLRRTVEMFFDGELDPATGEPPVEIMPEPEVPAEPDVPDTPEAPEKNGLAELISLLITFLKRLLGIGG